MSTAEKMPVWSRAVVDPAEFRAACRAIVQFTAKKPEDFDYVYFIMTRTQGMWMCASTINSAARINVKLGFANIEDRDKTFCVSAQAVKNFLTIRPSVDPELGATISITVDKDTVTVADESDTSTGALNIEAPRIKNLFAPDASAAVEAAQKEVDDGVQTTNRTWFLPSHMGAIAAAGKALGVESIDPIGLDKHKHESRVYVGLGDSMEVYCFVPTPPSPEDENRDVDGLEYDELIPLPEESKPGLRVVDAAPPNGVA